MGLKPSEINQGYDIAGKKALSLLEGIFFKKKKNKIKIKVDKNITILYNTLINNTYIYIY